MPEYDSHHHVVLTSEQWDKRSAEYWVVPRGCLCVELTPEGKTKIKVGEGSKYYSQLPYIGEADLYNYYTKAEVDNIINNINRMAVMSTEEYDSEDDLPREGNKLGDVRFVKSQNPSIKIDPDIYLWNGTRWIYIGYSYQDIDLSKYLKIEDFHAEFDPVKEKVEEMYPKMHTHENKPILDQITAPYTIPEKEKLSTLENYDDTEIRELIKETGHTHPNKEILDGIGKDNLLSESDREKLDSLHNYDDTEVKERISDLEEDSHTHTNKDILDQTTAPFTTADKEKLDSLENNEPFVGTDGRFPGVQGLVPAPGITDVGRYLRSDGTWGTVPTAEPFTGSTPTEDGTTGLVPAPVAGDQNKYLKGDGTWGVIRPGDKYQAGEGIYILSGEARVDSFPFNIYSKSASVKQYIIYGSANGVGDLNSGQYHIPIVVTDQLGNTYQSTIVVSEPLYTGDFIDFERQIFSHARTNITNDVQHPSTDTYERGINSSGEIYYSSRFYGWGGKPYVSDYYPIEAGATYLFGQNHPDSDFNDAQNVNIYDANKNYVRTLVTSKTDSTLLVPNPGEAYFRQAYVNATVFKYKSVEEPCILQGITLFPNTINTITVNTTNPPAEVYIEAEIPEVIDPDDPLGAYTGIIYNEGVLDVTQEDPLHTNILTVRFRDNVTKTVILPQGGTYTLPPATPTSLGGIIVGAGLDVDANGILSVENTPQTEYVAADGIVITPASDPITDNITHIMWEITATRGRANGNDTGAVQAAEIEFYDENDQLIVFSTSDGKLVASIPIVPVYDTDGYTKTPDKLVDADTSTKCRCTNYSSNVVSIQFIFELDTPMNPQDLKNYRWYTADTVPNEDPVSWKILVSTDGEEWIQVDSQTNFGTPTARSISTDYFAITKPTHPQKSIGVAVGYGITFDDNGAVTLDETAELIFNCDYGSE